MKQNFLPSPYDIAEQARKQYDCDKRTADADQLARLQAGYAERKQIEAELMAVVESVTPTTDHKLLACAEGELAALRRVLASFPSAVRDAYSPPRSAAAGDEWKYQRARALRAEIEHIERHELPTLEAKLASNEPLTARELGAWANFPGQERERHYNLLREQIAAHRARVEQCRAELAQA